MSTNESIKLLRQEVIVPSTALHHLCLCARCVYFMCLLCVFYVPVVCLLYFFCAFSVCVVCLSARLLHLESNSGFLQTASQKIANSMLECHVPLESILSINYSKVSPQRH